MLPKQAKSISATTKWLPLVVANPALQATGRIKPRPSPELRRCSGKAAALMDATGKGTATTLAWAV